MLDGLVDNLGDELDNSNYTSVVEFTKNAIIKEWAAYSSSHEIQVVKVCTSLHGGMLDYPKKVSKLMGESVERWETMLSTSLRSCEEAVAEEECITVTSRDVKFKKETEKILSSSFVEMVMSCSEMLREHIIRISLDIIKSGDMFTMYVITSSGSFIRNRLWYYDQKASQTTKEKPLHQQYKQFCDLVEMLAQQALEYHTTLIKSVLLYDAESCDWSNPHAWHEDDSITTPVHMWWHYLQATRHDMWWIMPPRLSQRLLAGVVNDSLAFITMRYTQIKISPARLSQYKRDVCALLLYCADVVLCVCTSVTQLLSPHPGDHGPRGLHKRAGLLLTSLALLSTPAVSVYQYLDTSKSDVSTARVSTGWWLHYIQPELYSSVSINSLSELSNNSAVTLLVNSLTSQPEPSWHMLTRALLMRSLCLSSHVVSSLLQYKGEERLNWSLQRAQHELVGCGQCLCRASSCAQQHNILDVDVISALVYVVCEGCSRDDCLYQLMQLSLKFCNFNCLDRKLLWNAVRPTWYEAILDCMEPPLLLACGSLLTYIEEKTGGRKIQDHNFNSSCLHYLLNEVTEVICTVPKTILHFCTSIAPVIPPDVHLLFDSVLATFICSSLYTLLTNKNKMAAVCENNSIVTPSITLHELLLTLAERLCNLNHDFRNHFLNIDKEIGTLLIGLDDIGHLDCGSEDKAIDTAHRIADCILSTPRGQRSLQVVYKVLVQNVDSIPGILANEATVELPLWDMEQPFNPLRNLSKVTTESPQFIKLMEDGVDTASVVKCSDLSKESLFSIIKLTPDIDTDHLNSLNSLIKK